MISFKQFLKEAKKSRAGMIRDVRQITTYIYFVNEDTLYALTKSNWEIMGEGYNLTDKNGNNPSEIMNEYFPRGYTKTRAALGRDIKDFWPDAIVFPEEEEDFFVAETIPFPEDRSELVLIEPNDKYNLDQETRDQWGDVIKDL